MVGPHGQHHHHSGRNEEQQEPDDSALYATDDFRIYCMKVLPCSKRYCHDWTTCPFAHPGEKARRRDPRSSSYTGIACPDMKKDGVCVRGELCPYAHNVFEYWLHPTRYRTQLCNDGTSCKRRVCFFAHTLSELRVPSSKPFVNPQALQAASAAASARRSSGGGHLDEMHSRNLADAQGAQELAARLATLQMGRQQQPQQPQQQDDLLLRLLNAVMQQKQQRETQRQVQGAQSQQLASLNSDQLTSLYHALSAVQQQPQQQLPQHFDNSAYGQPADTAAVLAQMDPALVAQILGKSDLGPTPRSSLDLTGSGARASEFSTPRTSFDTQGRSGRSSFDAYNSSSFGTRRTSGSAERTSFDNGSRSLRNSMDVGRRGSQSARNPAFLQNVAEDSAALRAEANPFDAAAANPHFNAAAPSPFGSVISTPFNVGASPFDTAPAPLMASGGDGSPMAFGPGAAYFLTRESAAAGVPPPGLLPCGGSSDEYEAVMAAASRRFSSLPANLNRDQQQQAGLAASGQMFSAMPGGLNEEALYAPGDGSDGFARNPRRMSADDRMPYNAAAAASSAAHQLLPPRPPMGPGSRRVSFDLAPGTVSGGFEAESFQPHLLGALPGSFNYNAAVAAPVGRRSGEASPAFGPSRGSSVELRTGSGSSAHSAGNPFANQALSALDAQVSAPVQNRRPSLGSLYEPTGGSSRGGSGHVSPSTKLWAQQPQL